MDDNSLVLQPGYEHFLSLSGKVYSANGIENIDPEHRNCFFPHEGGLQFYEHYSYKNCRFECGILLTEKQIGCTPWYLPQQQNSTLCDPWKARKFNEYIATVYSNGSNCRHCLADCELTKTVETLSSAKFR